MPVLEVLPTPTSHPTGGGMLDSDLQRRKAVRRDLSLGMVKLPGSSTFRAEAGRQIFCFLSFSFSFSLLPTGASEGREVGGGGH